MSGISFASSIYSERSILPARECAELDLVTLDAATSPVAAAFPFTAAAKEKDEELELELLEEEPALCTGTTTGTGCSHVFAPGLFAHT